MANWDHRQHQLYDQNGSLNAYELESGSYVIPLAEAAPTNAAELATWSPVAVIQVHAPYRMRRVYFKGRKNGSPPILPSPVSAGASTFLWGTLAFQQPTLDATAGNLNWEGTGQYEFVETCRSSVDDGFLLLNNPFTQSFQVQVQQHFSPGTVPYGAVAQAGPEARIGYTIGSQMDLTDPFYTYIIPSFVPGQFFNADMLNGHAHVPNL